MSISELDQTPTALIESTGITPDQFARLKKHYETMSADGKLLGRTELERYYRTFQERFDPQVLASLDGERLLDLMHKTGNKESLVHWLEYKNDDEMPSMFGSISGGSALKFGIFWRSSTSQWMAADEGNAPKEIPLEEAIRVARRNRDEFIKGCEYLTSFPKNGTDENYRQLQEQLDRDAPNVSRLAWGHKYFSLMFPDLIDDFHSPGWQHYHLIKLLQTPPEGEGRYVCAGRFIRLANALSIPVNNLTALLNSFNGQKHAYWRIGTSDGSSPKNRWEMMRDGGFVAIGWEGVGDLSDIRDDKESRDAIKKKLEVVHPNTPSVTGRTATQIVRFAATIKEGDIVLACDGLTVIGVGRVVGPYTFHEGMVFPHHRPVEWLSLDEWKMPISEGLQTTVHPIRKHPENLLKVEKIVQNAPARSILKIVVQNPATVKLRGIPGHIQSVLERKGQVVLYGPPGTGKTFWSEIAANEMAALYTFGKTFSELSESEKQEVQGDGQTSGLVRMCCFHPGYGYEDFIEGYRPESVDKQIGFRLTDGLFKKLCIDASKAPDKRFYLIIDEFNRGDVPRIFGELLTVLEWDKRGKAVILPVSGQPFRVPPNIYLISTMNTADRSISLLDAALRRRFGFIELMPDSKVLKDHFVQDIPLGAWFDLLNQRICRHVGKDSRNLQIGHSYFLHEKKPVKDLSTLKRVIRDDVIPLLEEYCYDDFTALLNILGAGLVHGESRRIRHELFEEGAEERFKEALRCSFPEIAETPEALSRTKPDADDVIDDEDDADGEIQ